LGRVTGVTSDDAFFKVMPRRGAASGNNHDGPKWPKFESKMAHVGGKWRERVVRGDVRRVRRQQHD
jgi:hypothetical protein